MNIVSSLLQDVDAYLREAGVAASTFGRRAVNDGKFVARLRDGGGITVATVDRVRAYIASERARLAPATPRRKRRAV